MIKDSRMEDLGLKRIESQVGQKCRFTTELLDIQVICQINDLITFFIDHFFPDSGNNE